MKTILLIEDNPEVRENTAEILELSGYDVLTAEDGKIGVKKAQEHLPDLVISDIMMPGLDGYGVLRILNREPATAQIPFIFLTAKAEMEDLRKGMNLGADDYLTKPFDDVELLDCIETRLQKHTTVHQQEVEDQQGLDAFLTEAKQHDALENLKEDRENRSYGAKEIIFREGEVPFHVFFVKQGKIRLHRSHPDAKEFITRLYKKGDFMGFEDLLAGKSYQATATAWEDSELILIPKDDFFSLIHNNRDISTKFIHILAGAVQEKEEQLLHLAYDTVRKRVADALLKLKQEYQEENTDKFSMRVSREVLASMVGTSKECVIRVLSDFKSDGIVRTDVSMITITDEQKLQQLRW